MSPGGHSAVGEDDCGRRHKHGWVGLVGRNCGNKRANQVGVAKKSAHKTQRRKDNKRDKWVGWVERQ